uniref:Uncharacterized protein n=1 Tax=Arundo donax TaxID=35708 RepID=A0A0A9EF05_ARUDO
MAYRLFTLIFLYEVKPASILNFLSLSKKGCGCPIYLCNLLEREKGSQ